MAGWEENGPGTAVPCADPHGDPFLRARFAVPALPVTFLRRERLVDHLDQALRTPLTMVNGSAGAGKTMLVADWTAGRAECVAWLTTDAADLRPGMFWAYLLQALRACGAALPADVGDPADASSVSPALLARLAAALSVRDRPVTVVLDEYDRVSDPEIAEQLEFVLHHAGEGIRLILVTRTEPLLPLHRYRTAGGLTEIRDAELAFTPGEADALLERHGLHLPEHAVRGLVERTRGWAAGLRLCALAARESPDPETYLKEFEADRSTVADFLLAEVLKRQSPETQDLLLSVSVLERFCPALANALTRRTDAEPLLAGLHRENAFVEHLGHGWYRLHPLFGEILRAHLRMRSPGLEPELHRRAAVWLRRSGSLTETLDHGAAAGDWDLTARALVDDLAIGRLLSGLRADDLAELFSPMGPEADGPAPDLVRAACELSRCDLERGLAHLHHAEQGLARLEPGPASPAGESGPAGDAPDPAAARLSCALLEALAARLTGSPDRAERAAETAERLRAQVPARLLDEHPELTALLLTHLGSTRLWAGRLDAARDALSAVAGGPGSAWTAPAREEALGRLALIDYLNGWLGRAERKAAAALSEAERFSLPRSFGSGVGRVVLAAVAVERDEPDRAQALLDVVAAPDPSLRDPVLEAARALAAARLLLARGDPRAALDAARPDVDADVPSPWSQAHTARVAAAVHLAEGRPREAAGVLRGMPDEQVACAVEAARVQLAAGSPGSALELLDGLHPQTRLGPAVTVRALLVRAQAADETGDAAAAHRLLAQALREARRERLRRPFHEAAPWIGPFLDTTSLRALAAGWLTPGPAPVEERPPVVEELSGRERDVLRRLAQMMSTEEIAADLYLSVNTVKTHLKSVYRKLAVNRRHDAVHRARELNLL
ncbi:LuxR C-terminal-related transcriptional regulator [Streptomyces sp. NBC_01275]|uniref:LuxR C-terminal-related transcriptional regulator n=1 Tax=Streptomyces sp. NBC_01275 TaxID=2903807 RepID=UPI00225600B0|nr:LuxR C-terminal-related transcriptional regulator [Streptomyces sp. NBC_01275]MCX4767207.1 LuxR C-terminal-related transcriptional regulator [Streptomyces sp. NBC_01275]